ncbi:AAA family ATPase [Paenibacillus barcinonensis]|uniref:AAA domain-containing protein n=1 Tax=Paenibacillus barcinonensis TaxID=198119 RepID=A0A2V4VNY9_PAEBA|nr:AAA family ATPase [Paenibacillus barcinonensis]PYE51561.1 AAA domain-containing protein [Paenibacillus barcinonensis]QKS55931.1 AAA family ATPase [Paenibacillus barcinonensis]
MGLRDAVINNVPKVALHGIRSLIVGNYKSGKTRLWKEVTELHYDNPDDYMLLSFEKGWETWSLKNVVPIHAKGKTPADQWEYFRSTVVKDLVEEASTNKIVKLLGVDTADKAMAAAEEWVIRDFNKRNGSRYTSLKEISDKTTDNGYTLLTAEMNKQFDTLENSGYGTMSLAWSKERETTLRNGNKFTSIDMMMSATGKKVFESQASLICTLYNDTVILDKDGNELDENIKDKKGKDKASAFHETQVMMLFRPNEFVSIGGGRYVNLPSEPVPYSSKEFMRIYEEAVKGQMDAESRKNIVKIEEEQETVQEQKAQEFAEKEEAKASADDLINAIQTEVDRFSSNDKTEKIVPKFKDILGVPNFRTITDTEKLQEALDFVKSI